MYEMLTLPNGLRIVYEHMPSVRSAAVGLWIGVGSRYEKYTEAGSAHFIEHMLFKGTKNHSAGELAGLMDGIGGQCNAFTSRDSTCFYARVLDTHLDMAGDILSEMFFDSLFREEDVKNERGVVLEEIDMYEDAPEDLVVERLVGKVFPGALGRPVLGRKASLENATGASLRAFMEREYRPDRIVVSVCGSFTDESIRRLAERFSVLLPGKITKPSKSIYTPACTLRRKPTEQNHFCLAWKGLPTGHPDRFAWNIMSAILGGGMSSRLFQTVREKNGLCYSIGSFTASYEETGLFGVSTAVNRDSEEKALSLVGQEVRRFCDDGLLPGELDRARESMKSNVVMAMESSSARMNRLGASVLQLGGCLSADDVIERYDAVTEEDVLRLARESLRGEYLSFSAVGRLAGEEDYLRLLK